MLVHGVYFANLALHSVPENVDFQKIKSYLNSLPTISEVHDLHVWAMSTTENVLSAHLIQSKIADSTSIVLIAVKKIHEKFGIEHVTLQFETKKHRETAPQNQIHWYKLFRSLCCRRSVKMIRFTDHNRELMDYVFILYIMYNIKYM